MSVDIISLVLVVEVVWRRDRRGDGECQRHLAPIMVMVVGRRDRGQQALTLSRWSLSWRWFGGETGEGMVNVDVILPPSW